MQPAKKRKPAKVPKGASELFNKWQAVRKDLVRPLGDKEECLTPHQDEGMDGAHCSAGTEPTLNPGLTAPE